MIPKGLPNNVDMALFDQCLVRVANRYTEAIKAAGGSPTQAMVQQAIRDNWRAVEAAVLQEYQEELLLIISDPITEATQ